MDDEIIWRHREEQRLVFRICVCLASLPAWSSEPAIRKTHGAMAMQVPFPRCQMTTGVPDLKMTAGTNARVHPARPAMSHAKCRLSCGQVQYSQSASLARHGLALGITPYTVGITPYFDGCRPKPQEYYPIIT